MELNHHVNNHNAGCDHSQVRFLINLVVSPLNVMFFSFGVSNENQKSIVDLNEWSKQALEEAVTRQKDPALFYLLCSVRAQTFLCPAGNLVNK